MRANRGTLTEPGRNSPFRDRSVEENLDLFRRMRAGEFPNGARVLRAKIDMASGNINLRDPVIYRILNAPHPRTGTAWHIYPSYDFAHGQSDAIEGVTHSLCTLEFADHRPLYDWFIENLPVPSRPRQTEFARLNLTHTVLSKRVLTELVRERPCRAAGTIRACRRSRGFAAAACRRRRSAISSSAIGVARADSLVDVAMLDHAIRDVLNQHGAAAHGGAAAAQGRDRELSGRAATKSSTRSTIRRTRRPDRGRCASAARSTSSATTSWRTRRRNSSACRRGRRCGSATPISSPAARSVKDAAGEVIELRCTYDPETRGGNTPPDGRKVKATLHWVAAADAVPAEVRLVNQLFQSPSPDVANFAADLNPDSLEVLTGALLEPAAAASNADEPMQFERQGYFRRDRDSAPGKPVFVRTVGLRDTFAQDARPESR